MQQLMVAVQHAEASDKATLGELGGLSETEWDALRQQHEPIKAHHLFADQPWICRRQWQVPTGSSGNAARLRLQDGAFVGGAMHLQVEAASVVNVQAIRYHCISDIVKLISTTTVWDGEAELTIPVDSASLCMGFCVMLRRTNSFSEWKQLECSTSDAGVTTTLRTSADFLVARTPEKVKFGIYSLAGGGLVAFLFDSKQTKGIIKTMKARKATEIKCPVAFKQLQVVRGKVVRLCLEQDHHEQQNKSLRWEGDTLEFDFECAPGRDIKLVDVQEPALPTEDPPCCVVHIDARVLGELPQLLIGAPGEDH